MIVWLYLLREKFENSSWKRKKRFFYILRELKKVFFVNFSSDTLMLSFLCNAIYPNFSISPDKQPNKTKSKVLSLRRLLTLTNRVKRDVLGGEGDNFNILDLSLLLRLNTLGCEIKF